MTNQQRQKLRTLVRQKIAELQAAGRFTMGALVEEVLNDYAAEVAEASDMLIREAIGKWARSVMKADNEALRTSQYAMPRSLFALELPSSICIAVQSGGDDAESDEDGEEEMLWTPLLDATFDELETNIAYLEGKAREVMRSARNLQHLRDYLAPHMADERRKTPIGEVLAEQAVKERARVKELAHEKTG